MNLKLIFILTLMGFAVLFGVQNVAIVEIQFLVWSFSVARSILIFFVLATGILVGWLMHSYSAYKEKHLLDNCSSEERKKDDSDPGNTSI